MKPSRTRPRKAAAAPTPPSLFAGLTAGQSKLVLDAAEHRTFSRESVIIRAGDPAEHLFFLNSGRAKYYRITKQGKEVLLWWIAPGDAFGIGTLIARPIHYIGTAEAIDDCELLVWSRERIELLGTAHGVLAQNVLCIALHYLTAFADRIVGSVSQTAEQRLANTLLQLGRVGTVQPQGVEISIMNEDLASLANVSSFTASRQLKEWERQGILRKRRAQVLIVSPEGLLID